MKARKELEPLASVAIPMSFLEEEARTWKDGAQLFPLIGVL